MLIVGGCQSRWASVEQALAELGIAGGVRCVGDVDDALTYLWNTEGALPSVVLLGIEDAGGDRLDALKVLKADERLQRIPVVVLAPSNDVRLVNESFALGAAGYMVEPADSREFAEAIRRIHDYWSLCELP